LASLVLFKVQAGTIAILGVKAGTIAILGVTFDFTFGIDVGAR